MHALYLFEFVLALVFLYAVFTQVIIPLWRDTPLLPWLETERKLTNELHDAKQGVVEAQLSKEIRRQEARRKRIRKEI